MLSGQVHGPRSYPKLTLLHAGDLLHIPPVLHPRFARIVIIGLKIKREKKASTTSCGMHHTGGVLGFQKIWHAQKSTAHPLIQPVNNLILWRLCMCRITTLSQTFWHAATMRALAPWSSMRCCKRLGLMPFMEKPHLPLLPPTAPRHPSPPRASACIWPAQRALRTGSPVAPAMDPTTAP